MNTRTTEKTEKEFNRRFLLWKLNNDGIGTREQFILYLLTATDGGQVDKDDRKICT
jgi:hypothetical protein